MIGNLFLALILIPSILYLLVSLLAGDESKSTTEAPPPYKHL